MANSYENKLLTDRLAYQYETIILHIYLKELSGLPLCLLSCSKFVSRSLLFCPPAQSNFPQNIWADFLIIRCDAKSQNFITKLSQLKFWQLLLHIYQALSLKGPLILPLHSLASCLISVSLYMFLMLLIVLFYSSPAVFIIHFTCSHHFWVFSYRLCYFHFLPHSTCLLFDSLLLSVGTYEYNLSHWIDLIWLFSGMARTKLYILLNMIWIWFLISIESFLFILCMQLFCCCFPQSYCFLCLFYLSIFWNSQTKT